MKKILALISRYSFWTIIGVILLIITILSVFLYYNLYRAITETEVIATLRSQYAVEPVSFQTFRNLKQILEDKKTKPVAGWNEFRNPFVP